jgi:hypothetical protein
MRMSGEEGEREGKRDGDCGEQTSLKRKGETR